MDPQAMEGRSASNGGRRRRALSNRPWTPSPPRRPCKPPQDGGGRLWTRVAEGGGKGRRAAPAMDAICAALEVRSGRIRRPPPELEETGETPPQSPAGPGTAAAPRPVRQPQLRSEASVHGGGARGMRARRRRAAVAGRRQQMRRQQMSRDAEEDRLKARGWVRGRGRRRYSFNRAEQSLPCDRHPMCSKIFDDVATPRGHRHAGV